MISTIDQENLFKLIAEYLSENISCVAIGGTAMMFSGYKNATKDIDIVFSTVKEREVFIAAIKQLGYKEQGLGTVYDNKRREHEGKPVMYSRGDERFDLFVKTVFGFPINKDHQSFTQKHSFIGKKECVVIVLSVEYLVLLKVITGREKDFEDIELIASKEKNLSWEHIVDEAIRHKKVNEWLLIDVEEAMQQLRKKVFIKEEYFQKLYDA